MNDIMIYIFWTGVNEIFNFQYDFQFSLLNPATKSIAIIYPAVQAWCGGGIRTCVLFFYLHFTGIHFPIVLFAGG